MSEGEDATQAERLALAEPETMMPDGQPLVVDHETLKYHLLGPSLTKSGQEAVDQTKVSEIIYNASKGSKFFNNEEVKDRNLTEKIDRILARRRQLDKLDLSSDLRRADEYISELEISRDLSQYIVHIDCDAFYAAVEELDRPELRDVPMAVGKGVLTTCNYHARKFGCRSGMAGFVAMKLCPELICLPLNFEKYTAKAEEVRAILAEYDPRFESASIDEAYLNITKYCHDHERDPEDVISQVRAEVFENAKITISAGIAANAKLAKIASNRNKPNGQFRLANDRAAIMAFMRDLPTRKVNGIGRVFERELGAIGIKTCGDIYEHRAVLAKLFGEKAFEFLIPCYLGIGRTHIQPAEEYERKSVGTESTFRDISSKEDLRDKLWKTAQELEKDLKRTEVKGRTLVLKVKLHTYEVLTRQTVPPKAVSAAEDLYKYSLPMLAKLEKEMPDMRLRLMGLRVTHIESTKKENVDFFGMGRLAKAPNAAARTVRDEHGEWEVWPEEEFEEAARLERQEEMEQAAAMSQEFERAEAESSALADESTTEYVGPRRHGKMIMPNPKPSNQVDEPEEQVEEEQVWCCPVCGRPQTADDRAFNEHIDLCLSRQTIQEAVKDTSAPGTEPVSTVQAEDRPARRQATAATMAKKRGRPASRAGLCEATSGNAQKKLFFG